MPDCVDTAMNTVQAARADLRGAALAMNAQGLKLPERDHAVLRTCNPRDLSPLGVSCIHGYA